MQDYILGSSLPSDHSQVLMFDTLTYDQLTNHRVGLSSDNTVQTLCACLNRKTETTLIFGASNLRIINGIKLDRQMKDQVRLIWDTTTTERIMPRIQHSVAAIYFMPVCYGKSFNYVPDTFVLEIHLKPREDILYSVRDGSCFIRRGIENIEIPAEEIREFAIRSKMKLFSQTIQNLVYEISELEEGTRNLMNDQILK